MRVACRSEDVALGRRRGLTFGGDAVVLGASDFDRLASIRVLPVIVGPDGLTYAIQLQARIQEPGRRTSTPAIDHVGAQNGAPTVC